MKKTTLLLTAALAGLFVSTPAFAGSDASCAPATVTYTKPVALKVVAPTELPRKYEKAQIDVSLRIDENGVPHNVRAASWVPRDLAARVLPAVQQWRFAPGTQDGRPISGEFILPLQIVADDDAKPMMRVQHTAAATGRGRSGQG